MNPILLSLGPVKLYSFGIFLFLAALVGSFVIWREGRNEKVDEEKLIDLLINEAIFGLIGARIYFLVFHFQDFGVNVFKWLLIFHFPGLDFIGMLFGGLVGLWFFSRRQELSFWQLGDMIVLGVAIGESIGRIGAFFSGTAYGTISNLPWAVPMIGLVGRRQPVQIYEAIVALIIFISLFKLKKIFAAKKYISGLILLYYFLFFGIGRFLIEFLRSDSIYFSDWRVNQIVCLIIIIFSALLLYNRMERSLKGDLLLIFQKARKSLSIKKSENQVI